MRIIHGAAIAVVLGAVTAPGCFFSPEEAYPGDLRDGGTDSGTEPPCGLGDTQSCYTGPDGTEDVSSCKAGTSTCSSDGQWGPCEGEVLPAAENCGTSDDEDCDGHGWFETGDTDCLCQPGATVDCYTGPDGTEGVGICKSGTGICNADGRSFAECQNEVWPSPFEVCTNNSTDDNCDGTPCNGDVLWALAASGNGPQIVYDMAVDSNGNMIVVGQFSGVLTLDSISLSSRDTDAFIVKLSKDGEPLWAHRLGGTGDQRARTVALDATGNIYIAGDFKQSLTFDQAVLATAAGGFDVFVLKLDPAGAMAWAKAYGDYKDQLVGGIATTDQGGAVLTGRFDGKMDFGGGVVDTGSNITYVDIDLYIVYINADGDHIWSKRFGDLQSQYGTGVAASAHVYVTGYFSGDFDTGAGTLNNAISSDALAMRRALANGDPGWAKGYDDVSSGSADQRGLDIALDESSNVLITGDFGGSINFFSDSDPSHELTTFASPGGFIAKLDSNGGHVWSKAFGSSGSHMHGRGVATDAQGNVLVTGEFEGPADFGGGDLTSSAVDVFVAKFTPDGMHTWSRRFGDEATQVGAAIDANPEGDVIIAGTFQGSMVLGNTTVTANNSGADQTLFIAKLAR